jgi:hypothetical protein
MLLRSTTTTKVGSFAHPRLDVLPRPFANVRTRGRRSRAGPADEPTSMLLLQTFRGIDGKAETMRTSDLFDGKIKMRKEKANEKGKKIEKDFIFFIIIIIYIYIYIYICFFLFAF